MNNACGRKINLKRPKAWRHHRHGWRLVSEALKGNFHHQRGIRFLDWADGVAWSGKPVEGPWVGIFHGPATRPKDYRAAHTRSLSEILREGWWGENGGNCLGAYTLCRHTRGLLEEAGVRAEALTHPSPMVSPSFSFEGFLANPERMVVTVGSWMRRLEAIGELHAPGYRRAVVCLTDTQRDFVRPLLPEDVECVPWMPHARFDRMLCENVVFLDLYDVAACNTILDCLMRATPLLVRRLPACEEYLGPGYPLFFSDCDEASDKLADLDLVLGAHLYLAEWRNRPCFSLDTFLREFSSGGIYSALPTP